MKKYAVILILALAFAAPAQAAHHPPLSKRDAQVAILQWWEHPRAHTVHCHRWTTFAWNCTLKEHGYDLSGHRLPAGVTGVGLLWHIHVGRGREGHIYVTWPWLTQFHR